MARKGRPVGSQKPTAHNYCGHRSGRIDDPRRASGEEREVDGLALRNHRGSVLEMECTEKYLVRHKGVRIDSMHNGILERNVKVVDPA